MSGENSCFCHTTVHKDSVLPAEYSLMWPHLSVLSHLPVLSSAVFFSLSVLPALLFHFLSIHFTTHHMNFLLSSYVGTQKVSNIGEFAILDFFGGGY